MAWRWCRVRGKLVIATLKLLPGYPATNRLRLRYAQFRADNKMYPFIYRNRSTIPPLDYQMSFAFVDTFPLPKMGSEANIVEVKICGNLDGEA